MRRHVSYSRSRAEENNYSKAQSNHIAITVLKSVDTIRIRRKSPYNSTKLYAANFLAFIPTLRDKVSIISRLDHAFPEAKRSLQGEAAHSGMRLVPLTAVRFVSASGVGFTVVSFVASEVVTTTSVVGTSVTFGGSSDIATAVVATFSVGFVIFFFGFTVFMNFGRAVVLTTTGVFLGGFVTVFTTFLVGRVVVVLVVVVLIVVLVVVLALVVVVGVVLVIVGYKLSFTS